MVSEQGSWAYDRPPRDAYRALTGRAAKDFDPSQIHFMPNLLSFVSFGYNRFEPFGVDGNRS